MIDKKLLNFAKEYCAERNVKMLYLSHFGSKLYGTNTENSDIDLKGIFLPNEEDLLLGKLEKFSAYSTGNNGSKNSKDDIDLEMWSLHNFLRMVQKGETAALDLLFSFNTNVELFCDNSICSLFTNYDKLFNPLSAKAFTGYALSQANKYSIKGSRLSVLENVYNYVNNLNDEMVSQTSDDRLSKILNDLYEQCGEGNYCKKVIIKDGPNGEPCNGLQLLGKEHHEHITLREFKQRIDVAYSKYGKRAHKAKNDNGKDWKALSHAYRALVEMKELLLNGRISFPLNKASEILEIKLGKMDWDNVDELIANGLKEVDELIEQIENEKLPLKANYNENFKNELILSFYKK